MKPTVTIENFKQWYFDGDTKKSEGESLVNKLIKDDKLTVTIQDVFSNCGYIPASICNNLTKEQLQLEDLEFIPSEVELVEN